MLKEIDIYTDASYRLKTEDGSYGYLLLLDNKIFHIFGKTTKYIKTNCLELLGIKCSLNIVLNKFNSLLKDIKTINVYTDSQNSIKYINGTYNIQNKQIGKINTEILNIMKKIKNNYPNIKVNFIWVKAHSTSKLNNIIDKVVTLISDYNKNVTLGGY